MEIRMVFGENALKSRTILIPQRNRAIFLDRDGVINRAVVRNGKPHSPANVAEMEILPGVPEALHRLHAAGFLLIVVTNQPNVSRGIQTRASIEAIHTALRAALPLSDIRVCYHDDADGCRCRKPAAGMLLDATRDEGIDLSTSFMVGDRWRDIEAGRRAGCKTVFIDYDYAEPKPVDFDFKAASLAASVEWILSHSGKKEIPLL